jgi:hypothetical protein
MLDHGLQQLHLNGDFGSDRDERLLGGKSSEAWRVRCGNGYTDRENHLGGNIFRP